MASSDNRGVNLYTFNDINYLQFLFTILETALCVFLFSHLYKQMENFKYLET